MLTLGSILALAAAALHVVIFRLESLAWGGAQAQKVFGEQSPQEVAATRDLAFNQGFYNLFLAVLAALGAVLVLVGTMTVGATLLAGRDRVDARRRDRAALLSSPAHRAAAVKQGALPPLAVLATVIGLLALTLPVRGAPGRPQRRIEARWSAMRSTASASTSACGRVTRRRWSGSG
ncbi:DUF1304 family protein [Brachybacterium sp. GPGPB12]|uniref:DUF1304 domain-containing protein n=1 Tax=Brachybacterium sp. GPGPB12 TaxID=3023517 RepID=UPI0031344198